MTDSKVTELSIADLFNQGQYTIPIYQRNYAWGEPEVEQLLQDVLDVAIQADKDKESYYIGSLVVYERDNGDFETIDGQQRHTTLGIILAALLNEFNTDIAGVSRINLAFDSRPKSEGTLRSLFSGSQPDTEERTMRSAYQVVTRFLENENQHVEEFKEFLLNRVKVLRVVVPQDTDLNHYFEIMNNRGEQLEKHEVLKARLMNELASGADRSGFSSVWDACSEMNRYVQLSFNSKERVNLFGKDVDTCSSNFDEFCSGLNVESDNSEVLTLKSIVKGCSFKIESEGEAEEGVGAFSSVINFSNFLLHVLRITTTKDVPLDDKRLLATFEHYNPDPKQFVMALLKCRMLFDRYIIKRENDEDWSLKSLKLYVRKTSKGKRKNYSYINSFKNEKANQQLVMILSMFHVSFPALVYKHWLNGALNWLYNQTDDDLDVDSQSYLEFLEGLNDRFFYGRFNDADDDPFDYYELIYSDVEIPLELDLGFLSKGTAVQNFIFNRLDYLLWRKLKEKKKFPGIDMSYVMKRLNGFTFTFRTSVEHYFPQNPLSSDPMLPSGELPNGVDSFGNLCLISRSDNSKLSNYLPAAKREHYEKVTAVESLKQVFMMSYKHWGPEYIGNIEEHEEMMVDVLLS